MCTGSRLTLLLKHADRTLQHKPLSTTEGQRVALMNLGSLTEIRGDSINSGHMQMVRKAEVIELDGYLQEKTAHACDSMMGCASADITNGTTRTSIIKHSLMPMVPSEYSICHTNLGTTMFHTWEWLLINAITCDNEDYAKICMGQASSGHLVFAHDAYRVSHCTGLVLFTNVCLKCIWVPGMCPEPRWIDYSAPSDHQLTVS